MAEIESCDPKWTDLAKIPHLGPTGTPTHQLWSFKALSDSLLTKFDHCWLTVTKVTVVAGLVTKTHDQ